MPPVTRYLDEKVQPSQRNIFDYLATSPCGGQPLFRGCRKPFLRFPASESRMTHERTGSCGMILMQRYRASFLCDRGATGPLFQSPPRRLEADRALALHRGRAFVDSVLDFRPELGRVGLAVNCDGMLDSSLDQFVFPIRGDCHGALHLTREFAAVYIFPCHAIAPDIEPAPRAGNIRRKHEGRQITGRPGTIILYEEPGLPLKAESRQLPATSPVLKAAQEADRLGFCAARRGRRTIGP